MQSLEAHTAHLPVDPPSETTTDILHTSPSATTTAAASPNRIPEAQDDELSSPLLREWVVPPVAPAIILPDEGETANNNSSERSTATNDTESRRDGDDGDASTQYTYPVATFVRDLVRTSMDQLYASADSITTAHSAPHSLSTTLSSSSAPSQLSRFHQHQHHHRHDGMHSLSVRSEGSMPGQASQVASATVRTLNDLDLDEDAEFILVDGDLVALPPAPPNEEERDELEFRLRSQVQSCQPSRVRRGVRKIGKWMKKRRSVRDRALSRDSGTSLTSVDSHEALPGDGQQQQQQQQHHESLTSPKRRQRRRDKRRSWRRSDSNTASDDHEDLEGEEFEEQFYGDSLEGPPIAGSNMTLPLVAAAAGLPSMTPIREAPVETSGSSRAQSVTASFVGTADQVLEAAVLPAGMAAAEAYIEFDDEKKDDGGTIMMSLVPPDADMKVDKAIAPDVESMLRRAAHDTATDIGEGSMAESSMLSPLRFKRRGKSDGSSVPLSQAVASDPVVHNDILKVVMVAAPQVDKSRLARAIRQSSKPPRKRKMLGVDVHTWQPDEKAEVRCQIWDVQGATTGHSQQDSANFGAHVGTQSLFFSAKSLYLLVWDLAASNSKTMRYDGTEDDCDDDDDCEDDFLREEANRQADRALYADIQASVLSWVDCIARRGPKSAILPIAVIPAFMAEDEAKRRCDMMQSLLEQHVHRFADDTCAPKLITGADSMLCVDYAKGLGIEKVQKTILAIATDSSRSVFDHVGTPVPRGTLEVLEMIRRLKQDHKLILLDHFLGELGSILSVEEIVEALHFLTCIGEILYFGTAGDEVLSRYIILSRKWLVSALSCILRNDLKRELTETRRFMNMQCIYSDQKYSEDDIAKALVSGTASSCPLLSDSDASMLWQSMSFMREAADRHSQLTESSTTTPTMFYFLERLLVHSGIFLPLGASHSSLSRSEVFFVPSLLAQADPRDVWTYKSSESWMTTLCHSWLFRDGTPSDLMEHVTVSLLKELYEFSRDFNDGTRPKPLHRSQTLPVGRSSLHDFIEDHDEDEASIGRIKINHIMCWKLSLLVKISSVFADQESGELRESFVEVFVSIVDQSSSHCVASDAMRASMQRVVVSGKGQVGHQGRKLWKGGYQVVLDSVRRSLDSFANVDAQVVCPECLAHSSPHSACTWSWDSVLAVAESGSSVIRCMRGHRVNSNLICGTCTVSEDLLPSSVEPNQSMRTVKAVSAMLSSVVLVGLWDARSKEIRNVGSGVIVDKKLGLLVTAGHVLFNMEEGRQFGLPYFGLEDTKVVIGVIPDDGHDAVFRYFAEIVAEDIHNVDACVLRLTTRLKNDVNDAGAGCADQPEIVLGDILKEQLKSLKMTSRFELEESVRILGYNQGGEGVFEQGKHVNRSADFAKGYICKKFKAAVSDDSSSQGSSSDSSSQFNFSPREEIVIMCPTISGHSGGPCINDDGKVVGILSRADPVDRQRCYLVPSTELKSLVNQAKKQCSRPAILKSLQTM